MTVEVAEGQVREQSFGLQAEYDAIMTETSNASKSWVEGPFKLISSAKSGDSVKKTTDLDIRLQQLTLRRKMSHSLVPARSPQR